MISVSSTTVQEVVMVAAAYSRVIPASCFPKRGLFFFIPWTDSVGWGYLSHELRAAPTLYSFKCRLKTHLLTLLLIISFWFLLTM